VRLDRLCGCGLALAAVAAVAGCGGNGDSSSPAAVPAADVRSYVSAVEQVRLPVNKLLEGADPILDGYRDHTLSPVQASRRMAKLEGTFAGYLLKVQQISPSDPQLAAINRPYANTYFYEDSYLATLAADLREGDFDNLPDTQGAQRLAIIMWRTKLEMIAARSGVALPGDLQQAGRGEIAPEPPSDASPHKSGGS
jgi:hypothetical protein